MAQTLEWLTPSSPATPSALGAVLVTVSLPLADATGISFKWITLVLSLALGALVVMSIRDSMTRSLRGLYWVFNSLLVFSVSLGIGISASPPPAPPPPLPPEIQQLLRLSQSPAQDGLLPNLLGINNAHAQPGEHEGQPSERRREENATRPAGEAGERLTEEQRMILQQYLESQKQYQQEQQRYYKRWSW